MLYLVEINVQKHWKLVSPLRFCFIINFLYVIVSIIFFIFTLNIKFHIWYYFIISSNILRSTRPLFWFLNWSFQYNESAMANIFPGKLKKNLVIPDSPLNTEKISQEDFIKRSSTLLKISLYEEQLH